jgi:hypothetical protein
VSGDRRRSWARLLARCIVNERPTEDQIATLLQPLLRAKLRKADPRRESLMRTAARSGPRLPGTTEFDPAAMHTALVPTGTPPRVNGHDVSFDPRRVRFSEDA